MDTLSELLIEVAESKDKQAFERIYKEASPALMGLSLRFVNYDQELAEEVLQEAFIKIWTKADKFNAGKTKAITWMGTIVRNQAFDRLRMAKSRPQLAEEGDFEGVEYIAKNEDQERAQSHSEKIISFKKILEDLPEIQQKVVEQSLVYGYTHQEISQRLQLPLGTVKAWLRRNMALIKESMSTPECAKQGNCLDF